MNELQNYTQSQSDSNCINDEDWEDTFCSKSIWYRGQGQFYRTNENSLEQKYILKETSNKFRTPQCCFYFSGFVAEAYEDVVANLVTSEVTQYFPWMKLKIIWYYAFS